MGLVLTAALGQGQALPLRVLHFYLPTLSLL